MASRKPIVLGGDGKYQQLQAGDDLLASVNGLSGIVLTRGGASTPILTPVYMSGNDTYDFAKADGAITYPMIGMAGAAISGSTGTIVTAGAITGTTGEWDAVCDESIPSGLTVGQAYFLSPTNAGKITSVVPTTVGHYVVIVGVALSTVRMLISNPFVSTLL